MFGCIKTTQVALVFWSFLVMLFSNQQENFKRERPEKINLLSSKPRQYVVYSKFSCTTWRGRPVYFHPINECNTEGMSCYWVGEPVLFNKRMSDSLSTSLFYGIFGFKKSQVSLENKNKLKWLIYSPQERIFTSNNNLKISGASPQNHW